MLTRQRGVLNLFWVAVGSAVFAALAMAALFSMRYERNLFAEGVAMVSNMIGNSDAARVVDAARGAGGEGGGTLRKCVIDGKTVVSNTDCKPDNRSSKTIAIHDSRGIEAPKARPVVEPAPGSNPMIDKMIEKQL